MIADTIPSATSRTSTTLQPPAGASYLTSLVRHIAEESDAETAATGAPAAGEAEPEFRLELDAEDLELFLEEDESGLLPGGLFGLLDDGDGNPAGELRTVIGKLRWFRGVSYRSWLDEGVPRRSGRLKWARPGDPRP